jgi:hypothetical protein
MNRAIKNAVKMAVVETMHEPNIPINRPKKKQDIKLKNGNIIIHKYIKKYIILTIILA